MPTTSAIYTMPMSIAFRSKSESIKQLIQEKATDILILTETKVYTKSAIRLNGFQMFSVVRGKSGGGGLLIAVKHLLPAIGQQQ